MIEVEAKIRISNPAAYRHNIRKLARFVEKIKKIDNYYTLENLKNYPKKSLRIRKMQNIYIVNFKQRISCLDKIHAKNEQEFILKDITPFINLIKDFGFKKWLKKEKLSEIYRINNNFNIEINYVNNLGWFLEVEYLSNLKDIEFARKKVLDIVKRLGIDRKNLILEGYTKMLWDKLHKN